MTDKVILITGCSTGIGRNLAGYLSGHGYKVVATARRLETIEDLNAALKLQLDVTDNNSIGDAIHRVMERFGRIDVLINNAGYAIRGAVEEITDERIQNMFDVNVYGIIRMVRAIAPYMRKRGSGRIINIGSIGGKQVLPVNGCYSASKFAVEALSDALRWELAGFGIPVVLIEPGNIKTNFINTVQNNSEELLTCSGSAYYDLYQNYLSFTLRARNNEPGPEVVSRVVLKAIEASKPKARYKPAVTLMNRLLVHCSDGVKDFAMKAAFKIRASSRTFSK